MLPGPNHFDAFISYSHAKDRSIAIALQGAVQTLGKPWYRRRSLRVFRDEGSLSANPALWPSIEEALSKSGHFILDSPVQTAAASEWVGREVEWWRKNRDPNAILLALTDGELTWDADTGDFRVDPRSPLPASLKGAFRVEPYWIDLRHWRDVPRGARSDRNFVAAAAGIVSAITGVPKDDVISEEVRRQRRTIAVVSTAAALLALLALSTSITALLAFRASARASRTLELATLSAGDLLDNLGRRYGVAQSGAAGAILSDVVEQVRVLDKQLAGAVGGLSLDDQKREAAAIGTHAEFLKDRDPKSARQYAVEAKDLFEAMRLNHPNDYDVEYQVVYSYQLIAQIEAALGTGLEEINFHKANAAAIQFARDYPDRTSAQTFLYKTYEDVARSASDPNIDKLDLYNKALDVVTKISILEPTKWEYKIEVIRFHWIVGDLYTNRGDYARSINHYSTAMDILKKNEEKISDRDDFDFRVSHTYERIGDWSSAQSDRVRARSSMPPHSISTTNDF